MSYDTFLNSAYLRQGQADQFVKQTPAKRKEILADILDLSRYDQLEAKARERMKSAQAEATDLERDISGIDAELKAEPELREQLTSCKRGWKRCKPGATNCGPNGTPCRDRQKSTRRPEAVRRLAQGADRRAWTPKCATSTKNLPGIRPRRTRRMPCCPGRTRSAATTKS